MKLKLLIRKRLEDYTAKYCDGWDAAMRAAGVPRATAAAWRDKDSRTVPGPRHLAQLALAPGVRLSPTYLVLGEGEPRLGGEIVPARFDSWRSLTARGQRLRRAHELVLKALPNLDALPPVVTDLTVEAVVRWAPLNADDRSVRALARQLWDAVVRAPQQFGYRHPTLTLNAPSDRATRRFADHAIITLATLITAAPAPGEETFPETKRRRRRTRSPNKKKGRNA